MVKRTLLLLVTLLLTQGCAYQVHVLGSNEPEAPVPLSNAITIAVNDDSVGDDAEFTRETVGKIERLLTDRGYRVVSPATAEVLLFFRYERESTFRKVVLESTSGVTGGMSSVRVEPPYNHSLVLRVVDGDDYRADKTSTSYWFGEGVLNNNHLGGPKVIDMLLVAAFDYFAMDTGSDVKVSLGLENKRVSRLRQP